MDPLAALSVAGTIIQFVDFGSKLLSGSVELYRSSAGCLEIHQELELVTSNLKSVAIKIRRACPVLEAGAELPLSEEEQIQEDSIRAICDEATRIADEFLSKLGSLKIKSKKNRVWGSFKAMIKTAWSREEIFTLLERLNRLRDALNTNTMLSLRQKLNTETVRSSARFDTLDTQTQRILQGLVQSNQDQPREIIDSIAKMLCRLEVVNQGEHNKTRELIAYQCSPFGHTPSIGDITAQIEMLDVENKEEQHLRSSVQERVLESLRYFNMTDRYENLVEAHPKTFDWIFRDPDQDEELPWSNFGQWLREGKGIYWINGKAGSGKSTLMKHIYDDKKTKKLLLDWSCDALAGPVPCCVATFFFWNSGTDIQKSIQGLLRSLLFQVLGRCPDLIPAVFPSRWASLYAAAHSPNRRHETEPDSFSLRQLHDAFEKMVTQKHIPLKMCFLIDGLDEFCGSTMDLCMLFVRLAASTTDAKFCLSSRPWVEFQRSFEGCPSLKLQDLTYEDIATYVNDRFKSNKMFNNLATHDEIHQDEELVSSLTKEITQRAEGVFLWVTIVVDQLLRGIRNNDTISFLWKRLDGFPRELDPLYDRILSQIDEVYLAWASKAFQIMNASTKISSDPFHKRSRQAQFSEEESNTEQEEGQLQGVNALTLMEWLYAFEYDTESIVRDDKQLKRVLKVEDDKELKRVVKVIDTHLTARCAGLLEISTYETGEDALRSVRWMHRTARDFVNKNRKWATIFQENSPQNFSPFLALMTGSIKSLSLHTYSTSDGPTLSDPSKYYVWGENAWFYAYHANGHVASRSERIKLLRLLMSIRTDIPITFSSSVTRWENLQYRRTIGQLFPGTDRAFLTRATMYCLSDFVEDRLLILDIAGQRDRANDLMRALCNQKRIASTELPFPTAQMVTLLIMMGRFPRREYPPEDNAANDGSGKYDSGEDDSEDNYQAEDGSEHDSGEDDSGEDDSGEDDSGEDDLGEDNSGEDDSSEDGSEADESEQDDSEKADCRKNNDSEDDETTFGRMTYRPEKTNEEKVKIHPLELWSFMESQISIIQAFLSAGVDPTNSISYIPKNFILRKKELQVMLEKKVQEGCENVYQAQQLLEEALREEIRQQKECEGMSGKRKLDDMLPDRASTGSDPLQSEAAAFFERYNRDRGKRVKWE